MRNRFYVVLLSFVFAQAIFAAERKIIQPYETASFKMAATGLTRIVVEGDRIKSARGLGGHYQVENDEVAGSLFIKPETDKVFKVHLSTEQGRQYTLSLKPVNGGEDSIVLVPEAEEALTARKRNEDDNLSKIVELLQVISQNKSSRDYVKEAIHSSVISLGPVDSTHLARYRGKNYVGDVFELRNKTKKNIRLEERDFYKEGVVAVALFDTQLPAHGATVMYSVKQNG